MIKLFTGAHTKLIKYAKNISLHLALFFVLNTNLSIAQIDSTDEEEIDFSLYANAELAGGVKRYCTSKVYDISPNKLISIGFDYQGKHTLQNYGLDTSMNTIAGMGGLRLGFNVPVISKTNVLWSVGGSYWRMNYNFKQPFDSNYFSSALYERGLTTLGLNTTIFKPFNEKYFLLAFISADANGDFKLGDEKLADYLFAPKITLAALYGKKRKDRSMLAFGLTRTYRAGNQTVFPLILYNHTFENRKWGIECLFPSRFNLRRNFNPRNLLFVGYEMEGNSYSIINRTGDSRLNNFELRRSEIRPRVTFEKSLYGFVWLSVQTGYRINFRYDIDNGDIFRWLGDPTPYKQTNQLTNPLYFNISLNLVSP
ncbi:MAG: DUF6268 family outer membrane beta-barrel protein [Bacteroidia bacterium]